MRNVCAALWAVLLASPVAAQENLLQALTEARAAYPTPMTQAQVGELLNRVAWEGRVLGYGLHRKDYGHRCPQPRGVSISCDLLVHGPTGAVFDVLIDTDGEARPTWAYIGPINTHENFVAPTPPVVLTSQPPATPDVELFRSALRQLSNDHAALLDLLGEVQVQQQAGIDSLRAQIAGLKAPPPSEPPSDGGSWVTFSLKYVLPVVSAALATYYGTGRE